MLIVLCPCHLITFANLHHNRFIRFQNIMFTRLETDERTDGLTNERTDRRTGRKHYASGQTGVSIKRIFQSLIVLYQRNYYSSFNCIV